MQARGSAEVLRFAARGDVKREWIQTEKWQTVTPRLFVRDPVALVEFLKVAFNASCTLPEGDAPAEVWIGDSVVMVSSDAVRAATTSVLYVYVKDVDSTYDRATSAGATSIEEPTNLPYGDRRAAATDRWGNTWQIATRLSD